VTKRQRRLLVTAIILLVSLLALLGYYNYYRNTKQLSFKIIGTVEGTVEPPQFLYAFSGAEGNRLVRPVGITVEQGAVYVVDSQSSKIQVFNERGEWQRSIGASESARPLYIAKNPKDGNFYVTDRRKYAIHKYSSTGKYLGDFKPNLPKNQLPKLNTNGVQWVPIAITFGPDGTMYVSELLNGHRLLIFDPSGKFKKSVGTAAFVSTPSEVGGVFQFPNGLVIFGKELYVADSNNRRVQVFDLQGKFKRIIVTQGLPRGVAGLSRLANDKANAPARIVEVDTLSHDATIWTSKGDKVLSFGEQGVLAGQFNYPTAVSMGSNNKMFITDTANGRVQVWGWPDQVAALPIIGSPSRAWMCLLPLLLLPLLLLARRRRFYATGDFVGAMLALNETDLMTAKRVKWVTTADEYDAIVKAVGDSSELAELFEVFEYSESDVAALMSKYELDHESAVILAVAQRTRLLCTENDMLRVVAGRMELDAVNAEGFVQKFAKKREPAE